MNDIHPHWQATEPTTIPSEPGLRRSRVAVEPSQRPIAAARRPAAIVGILLTATLGILAFGGQSLFGQLMMLPPPPAASSSSTAALNGIPPDALQIHITDAGFVPQDATVLPGGTIAWINDTHYPHILRGDTLHSQDGTTLYTAAIFPGAYQLFSVSSSQTSGKNPYTSETTDGMNGVITVAGGPIQIGGGDPNRFGGTQDFSMIGGGTGGTPPAAPAASSSAGPIPSAPANDSFSSANIGTFFPAVSSVSSSSSVSSAAPAPEPTGPVSELLSGFSLTASSSSDPFAVPDTQNSLIPTNPNTIGTHNGPPLGQQHQAAPLYPTPVRQPTTGGDTWMIALVAALFGVLPVLFFTTRKKEFSF